jgi:arsenate reductase-like glutaredoxin family protein
MVSYQKAYNFIMRNYTKEEIKNILSKIDKKVEEIKRKCNNKYDTIEVVEAILNTKKDMHNIIKMFFVLYLGQVLDIDFLEEDVI